MLVCIPHGQTLSVFMNLDYSGKFSVSVEYITTTPSYSSHCRNHFYWTNTVIEMWGTSDAADQATSYGNQLLLRASAKLALQSASCYEFRTGGFRILPNKHWMISNNDFEFEKILIETGIHHLAGS